MREPAFTHRTRVELRDCDGLGHVNNAVYLSYIEEARTEYVFSLTGGRRLEDFDFILARAEIDFRSEATLHDELIVEVHPARVGTKSWGLDYVIRQADSGAVVVESTSVLVSYDFREGRSIPVPDRLRAGLEAAIG
jgi:acyl-CoA thioester hydrolase